MPKVSLNSKKFKFINVSHDFQKRILEITSFIRVLNNYYYLKMLISNRLKSCDISKSKNSLPSLEDEKSWLSSIRTKLITINEKNFITKDSFIFPDSVILFEAWMNLGMGALFPRIALHYKFPGFLKGEKVRNIIQFTFASSRGFGFPIYFGPEFYGYTLTYGKFLEGIFKWSHTVCHRANQAIQLVGNRYSIKRHHPGEFESVIVSEYKNHNFKAIDTLLHGYFTNAPKSLGQFPDLKSVIETYIFSYSIGDHAMSITLLDDKHLLKVPIIPYEDIVEKYKIDFFSYISKLKAIRLLLIKKILLNKRRKKELAINMRISRIYKLKANRSFNQFSLNIKIMEKLCQILWTTPLYTHTYHSESRRKELNNYKLKCLDSIFLEYIKEQETEWGFKFQEEEILGKLKDLRDQMASMWLPFKEKHFNFALKELNEISRLSLNNNAYISRVNEYVENLIPIFSIYEIFNRSLSESVYPESIPLLEI
ncbi:MAG: hypothetical protein ACFFKA_16135 [Candidatus Thorarchaeota archaeon]